jgi:hypothetical protein
MSGLDRAVERASESPRVPRWCAISVAHHGDAASLRQAPAERKVAPAKRRMMDDIARSDGAALVLTHLLSRCTAIGIHAPRLMAG